MYLNEDKKQHRLDKKMQYVMNLRLKRKREELMKLPVKNEMKEPIKMNYFLYGQAMKSRKFAKMGSLRLVSAHKFKQNDLTPTTTCGQSQ